ncbi:MAG TPA: Cof-type HAD-IIB family hydrolase [Caulobacteraceae bacterium]|nr:Cof-type HAD-IIB family hydrolase [Caulobacteraceae bacterium]
MPVAMIATDLDGTLIRSDGSVSARTRAALEAARGAGVVVAFVTARPPRSVETLADDLNIAGVAVCCNGALLYDLAGRRLIGQQRFAAGVGHAIVSDLRQGVPGVAFAIQHATDFSQEGHFPPYWDAWHDEPVARVPCALSAIGDEVAKIIVHHASHDAESLMAAVAPHVRDRAELSHSGLPIVELAPAGVSKASGLAALCGTLGIGAEGVVAFGDMPNDLEMLAFAGHSVGVANAHPDVLAAVREITLSNDEDGVAVVIERLLA